jgi:subtilisin family serine protease
MLVFALLLIGSRADEAPHPLPQALRERIEAAGPGGRVRVNVLLWRTEMPMRGAARRAWVADRQTRVLDALDPADFQVARRYRALNGLTLLADERAIERLLAHPDVRSVQPDRLARIQLPEGSALVGATFARSQGWTGAGVSVAVLDSGIDTDHAYLQSSLVAQQCFCDEAPFNDPFGCCPNGGVEQSGGNAAEDNNGHGTAVSGIITSDDVNITGVARDAGIVAIKVADVNGMARFSDIAAGLEWVHLNHDTYAIRVVNMSLGDEGEYDDDSLDPCSGTLAADAAADLHADGVVLFASAGNDAYDAGISFPACIPEVISVGGVYDAAFSPWVTWCPPEPASCDPYLCRDFDPVADEIVCHSNSGSLLDLLAPDWKTRTTQLGGGFHPIGGTSAASPYAAGEAAILLAFDPSLTPDDIRTLLVSSGPLITDPDNGLSFPRADVEDALLALPEPEGTSPLIAGLVMLAALVRRRSRR